MASLEININQVNADFQAIKTSLINSGVEIPEGTKTSEYADKIDKVYEGGVEDGKKSQRDEFWENYLKSIPVSAASAFAGLGWNKDTFKPPKGTVIQPVEATTQMFGQQSLVGVDLVELCEELNITIDFSQAKGLVEMFYRTGLVRVGIIDTRSAAALGSIFAYSNNALKTVDKVILKEDGSQTWGNNSFVCSNTSDAGFKEIRFEGKIGNLTNTPSINMQYHRGLSVESAVSIIECLNNYKGTDKDLTCKITFSSEVWTRLEATTPPEGYETWKAYVTDGKGWTT